MNERQFKRAIGKRTKIYTKDYIYGIILDLLNENKSLKEYKKPNFIERIFKKSKKEKNVEQILKDNFEYILNSENDGNDLTRLLDKLWNNSDTKNIIKENFSIILKRFDNEDKKKVWCRHSFFVEISKSAEGMDIIKENLELILKSYPGEYLRRFADRIKGISNEIDEKLEEHLERRQVEVARELLLGYRNKYNELNTASGTCEWRKEAYDDYDDTISIMIKELLQSENVKWLDIESLESGAYSDVYKIGDKVLKIGRPREVFEIPNHPRILQPLTRINLLDTYDNDIAFACVEITDVVESLKEDEYEDDELLYQIYKELRDDGIIWTDPGYRNLGILKRPNVPSLNGEVMDVAPNSVGFSNDIKGESVLEAGEIVIIDTDFLYRVDSYDITFFDKGEELEKRWQQEQQKKIAEKYRKTQESAEKTDREIDKKGKEEK